MTILKVQMGNQKYVYHNGTYLLALEDIRLFIEDGDIGDKFSAEFCEMTRAEYEALGECDA